MTSLPFVRPVNQFLQQRRRSEGPSRRCDMRGWQSDQLGHHMQGFVSAVPISLPSSSFSSVILRRWLGDVIHTDYLCGEHRPRPCDVIMWHTECEGGVCKRSRDLVIAPLSGCPRCETCMHGGLSHAGCRTTAKGSQHPLSRRKTAGL
jgi:hypothetical protein